MLLNDYLDENPLLSIEKDSTTNVKFLSFEVFKDVLMDLIQSIDPDEQISIDLSAKLLARLKTDEFFSKALIFTDLAKEDKIKLPLNQKKDTVEQTNTLKQYRSEIQMFLDSYLHLNSKKFNSASVADLIHEFVAAPRIQPTIYFGQWFITLEEYNHKLDLVQNAAQIFEKTLTQNGDYNESCDISNLNDKEATIQYMQIAIEDLSNGRLTIEAELNKIGKKWKKQAAEGFNLVYSLYFELDHKAKDFERRNKVYVAKKPGFLQFNNIEKSKFEEFEQLKKEAISLSERCYVFFGKPVYTNVIQSQEDIKGLLNEVNQKLADWPQSINNILSEKIGRLSNINTDNEQLMGCIAMVDEYILEMNSKNIWNNKIEINSTVFAQYQFFIDELLERCSKVIEVYSKEENRREWAMFLYLLPKKDQTFISKFIKVHPSKWVEEFKAYYYIKLLHSLHHPLTAHNQQGGKEIFLKYQLIKDIKSAKTINHLYDLFNVRYEKFKKSTPKLAKRILAEKNTILKNDFTNQELASVSAVFPIAIHLTRDEEISAIVNVVHDETEKTYEFSIQLEKPINHLVHIQDKMNDIAMTERFGLASNLAKSLLNYVTEFSILQLKNANIICLWPEPLSEKLKTKLDQYGVKQFKVKSREEEALIESIIESNRSQILLTINGLPNYECPEEIIDQYKVMEAFIHIGFSIINIWSVELLDNDERVFEALVGKLAQV